MKKSLVYFLAPIVGLIIFGAIYWNFSSGYEATEAAKTLKIKQEKDAKLLKQAKTTNRPSRKPISPRSTARPSAPSRKPRTRLCW